MIEPLYSARRKRFTYRKVRDTFFLLLFYLAIFIAIGSLITLLTDILIDGIPSLSWTFLTSYASQLNPDKAGILAPLAGTAWVVGLTALLCIPIGIATATYLEEFAPRGRITDLIQLNIANLAGVPSVIYGLLGLAFFVQFIFGGSRNLFSGAMTLALLVLPIIIIASQEAIRGVPGSRRSAAFAMGATRWQVVWHVVLPEALSGIMSGVILALSRAIGESAPILIISSLVFLTFVPTDPGDRFTVLPLQIYTWVSQPREEFRNLASAAIIVLLGLLLLMNSIAVFVRQRSRRHKSD